MGHNQPNSLGRSLPLAEVSVFWKLDQRATAAQVLSGCVNGSVVYIELFKTALGNNVKTGELPAF